MEKISNLPLSISEDSANVTSVLSQVSTEVFKGEAIILLDVDYLKLLDSNTTKGE